MAPESTHESSHGIRHELQRFGARLIMGISLLTVGIGVADSIPQPHEVNLNLVIPGLVCAYAAHLVLQDMNQEDQ